MVGMVTFCGPLALCTPLWWLRKKTDPFSMRWTPAGCQPSLQSLYQMVVTLSLKLNGHMKITLSILPSLSLSLSVSSSASLSLSSWNVYRLLVSLRLHLRLKIQKAGSTQLGREHISHSRWLSAFEQVPGACPWNPVKCELMCWWQCSPSHPPPTQPTLHSFLPIYLKRNFP